MNGSRQTLRRILGPTGTDAGCERSLEVGDQLVEEELAGRVAAEMFPDVALHVEACPDCREDYEGLRKLARSARGEGSASSP